MRSTFATRLTTLFTIGWHPHTHKLIPFLAWQRTNERRLYYPDTFLRSSSTTSPSADEEDLQRWEQMYAAGIGAKSTSLSIEPIKKVSIRNKVHVVTYDLDNTLWNTSATIGAANDALAAHMEALTCPEGATSNNLTITRVEKCMNILFKANPEKYGPTLATSTPVKSPVRLTALRKDAIRKVLLDEAGFSENDKKLDHAVEEAFGLWVNARHAVIPTKFALGVFDSLRAIRESVDVVAIGAITDGNSDPMAIPELQGYFDFCINAESAGIGKPDRRIYQRAIDHVLENFPTLRSKISAWSDDDDNVVDSVGPWWVHVGDDFVKDVVAAKNLGMRSIWSRELVQDRIRAEAPMADRSPKRDLESFVKEISAMDVVKMQIGDDEYLLDSIQNEFADAIVDRFLNVADTIHQWQSEAEESYRTKGEDMGNSEAPLSPVKEGTSSDPNKDSKFCLFCGTTLPQVARFCSSCGKEQL